MEHDVRYYQSFKTEWETNEISGHSWPVNKPLKNKWEVHGCYLPVGYFKSEEKALEEYERRVKMYPEINSLIRSLDRK